MASKLKKELMKYADPDKAAILRKFFKTGPGQYGEGDVFLGVTAPNIRSAIKEFYGLESGELTTSLHSKYHEERLAALLILVEQFKRGDDKTKKQIFDFYLKNTDQINNWDLIDLTAPQIVGGYLVGRPKDILFRLAKSKSLWERRIAMLACFDGIRKGDCETALAIAELLLHDSHDLIHKAVGWMLREIGKRCSEKILEKFLDKHAPIMPRVMLRYAIEKMDEDKRRHYLAKDKIIG